MADDDLLDRLREIEDRMGVSVLFSIEDRQTILDAVRRIEDLLEATNWVREQYEDAEAEVEKQADRLEAPEADERTLTEETQPCPDCDGYGRVYVTVYPNRGIKKCVRCEGSGEVPTDG